ncbi:MAG: flagellar protein FlgN [Bacillota bacterium]
MTNTRSLSSILSEIGSTMDGLLELGKRKAEILVRRDISGLEKLIPSEQDLVRRLEELESERQAVPAQSDSEIELLRVTLKEKAKRIAEMNERNRGLLRRGLDLVQYELKLFLQEGKPLVFDHRA